MICPYCDKELDYLDKIIEKASGTVRWELYICHNEECLGYGYVYHDVDGEPEDGDPSEVYQLT